QLNTEATRPAVRLLTHTADHYTVERVEKERELRVAWVGGRSFVGAIDARAPRRRAAPTGVAPSPASARGYMTNCLPKSPRVWTN
ncbi:MAG TPA: hypothetical protein VEQ42_09820, partial [Pyrinomonadaceae bacterium]|nr:hypothetical protein [Pyrinomonadaceae bacterium]